MALSERCPSPGVERWALGLSSERWALTRIHDDWTCWACKTVVCLYVFEAGGHQSLSPLWFHFDAFSAESRSVRRSTTVYHRLWSLQIPWTASNAPNIFLSSSTWAHILMSISKSSISCMKHRPAVPFFLRNSREVWAGVGPVGVMANVLQTVTNWCSLPKNFILLPHRVVSLISPQVLKPFVPSLLLSNVNIFRLHCCDLE